MESTKKVGIWLRVSTEDQAKGESPMYHEQRARGYAEQRDWEIVTVYHLEGVSGKAVIQHPEAKRMMEDIRTGKITGLIFSKLARLARSTKELLELAEYFKTCNADLVSIQELIDTSNPVGRLFYTIIAAMAQWEREEISDRVAASVPIRAKMGKNLGGASPYGYKWVAGTLKLEDTEAIVRKKIFEYYLESKRKKNVAKKLNDQGYRTRNGSLFTNTTITRLLRDPIAKGVRRANYTKSLGQGKNWELKDKDTWVFTDAPAIVSEDLWQKCNDIMDTIEKQYSRTTKVAVQLFGGLTQCHCGGKMYVQTNNPKYVCLKCRNKIPVEDLEEIFCKELETYLFSQNEISLYVKDVKKAIEEKKLSVSFLGKEISQLKDTLQNLLDLHQRKELPTEGFKVHYMPHFEQLKQKETYFLQLEKEIENLTLQCNSTDEVFKEAQDLQKQWINKTREEKRFIIEDITESIIIGQEDIEIIIKGIPRTPSLDLMTKGERNFKDVFPFCHKRLKSRKLVMGKVLTKPPTHLLTIGDHIRNRRLELGLFQRDVGKLIGVSEDCITNWEKHRAKPQKKYFKKIALFLGYNPLKKKNSNTVLFYKNKYIRNMYIIILSLVYLF